jgi:hypothetical protein
MLLGAPFLAICAPSFTVLFANHAPLLLPFHTDGRSAVRHLTCEAQRNLRRENYLRL